MLPEGGLSDPTAWSPFLYPDSVPSVPLGPCTTPRDLEIGGVDIGDAGLGMQVQVWQFRIAGDTLQVGPDPNGPWTDFLAAPSTTELSGTFDSSMNPVVGYVQSGITKLFWFDTSVLQYVVTEFPGASSPRLSRDDKRDSQASIADAIFTYLKDGKLYYRQQRDRYGVEYFLMDAPEGTIRLGRFGMNEGLRLQWEFITTVAPS